MRFIVFILSFVFSMSFAQAALGKNQKNIIGIVEGIGNFLGNVFLAVGVIIFLYSGYRYWQAGGDPKKVGDAHQNLLWAVIGLAVGLLAKSAPAFVDALLSGSGNL